MSATPVELNPDYSPDSWALGYQTSQFGVGADPSPGELDSPRPPGSMYAALATPPDAMTAAIELPNPAMASSTPEPEPQ